MFQIVLLLAGGRVVSRVGASMAKILSAKYSKKGVTLFFILAHI